MTKRNALRFWAILILLQFLIFQNSYSQPESKYIDSAKAILKSGEFSTKLIEYGDKIIDLNSSNPWGYILKAKYYIGFRPDSSLKYLEIAIPLDINNSYGYQLRAMAKIRLKDFGKGDCGDALDDLNFAKKLDPFNPLVYNTIGQYYEYCDVKWEFALKNYSKSLELKGNQEHILYARAWIKKKLGDTLGSLEDFNSAIFLNPNEAAFYDERGKLLFEMQKYQESYDDFNKSFSLGNLFALEGRGMAAYKSRHFKEAIEDFTSQLEKLSKDVHTINGFSFYNYKGGNILLYRGLCYYALEDKDMAYRDWLESSKLGDERAFKLILDYYHKVPRSLIDTLYVNGKYDIIISFTSLISEKNRNTENVIEQLANCYYMKENYDSSSFYYKKLLEINPENNTARLFGGISAFNIEKYELAANFLSKINENDKDDYLTILYYKGLTYYNLNKFDESLVVLKKLEVKDYKLNYLDARWYLGQIYYTNKNYEKASECFSFLIEHKSTENEEYYYLGLSHYFTSEFHKAIYEFSQQIEIDNSKGLYYLYRASSHKHLGDKENACSDFKMANSKDISVEDKEFEEFCK